MGKITGLKASNEYTLKLSKLGTKTQEVAGKAIYHAAGIVTDQIRADMEALPAVKDIENIKAYREKRKSQLSYTQKKGMMEGLGITKMEQKNGMYSVKIGFAGYNSIKTKKYPGGQPNALIARVVESGSTYMDKTPFIRPAVNATRKKAVQEMQRIIDDETRKVMD